MKIETMKTRNKMSLNFGLNFIVSKGNFYTQLSFGKVTFIVGIMK
jgi:hypothetical protein